jgi:uncharacterized cupin superfamily protein
VARGPIQLDDVPFEEARLEDGGVARVRRLGRHVGATHLGVNVDELAPGRFSSHFHYHLREEEHVFILEGSAVLFLGDAMHVLEAGDYCCFPAGEPVGHCLYNHTDAVCRFMAIGENAPDDTFVYPKTGVAMDKRTRKLTKL